MWYTTNEHCVQPSPAQLCLLLWMLYSLLFWASLVGGNGTCNMQPSSPYHPYTPRQSASQPASARYVMCRLSSSRTLPYLIGTFMMKLRASSPQQQLSRELCSRQVPNGSRRAPKPDLLFAVKLQSAQLWSGCVVIAVAVVVDGDKPWWKMIGSWKICLNYPEEHGQNQVHHRFSTLQALDSYVPSVLSFGDYQLGTLTGKKYTRAHKLERIIIYIHQHELLNYCEIKRCRWMSDASMPLPHNNTGRSPPQSGEMTECTISTTANLILYLSSFASDFFFCSVWVIGSRDAR